MQVFAPAFPDLVTAQVGNVNLVQISNATTGAECQGYSGPVLSYTPTPSHSGCMDYQGVEWYVKVGGREPFLCPGNFHRVGIVPHRAGRFAFWIRFECWQILSNDDRASPILQAIAHAQTASSDASSGADMTWPTVSGVSVLLPVAQ